MTIGMIGLGKMGLNMAKRLLGKGHAVIGFAPSEASRQKLADAGGRAATTIAELVSALPTARMIWVSVPAGQTTDATLAELARHCGSGDIVIDAGNTRYTDTLRHAAELEAKNIRLVDQGTSGGVWGLENGYCLMVGGADEAVKKIEPICLDLAQPDGFLHAGPAGAGHFVKMVHNGIEYAMLQAFAEGFEILKKSPYAYDLERVAHLWNHGSVVRSWLCELSERAFKAEGNDLADIKGYVEDNGEGRWTVEEAIRTSVPATAIAASLFARFASRQEQSFAMQYIAALRNQFGGHGVKREPTT